MADMDRDERLFHRLSELCLALAETERTRCGAHADFRIRGKVYAYFLVNYHADGIVGACFKTQFGEHLELVQQYPERCYLPRFLGQRGWFGVRLDLPQVDWKEIGAFAASSYDLMAPPALRKPVDPLRFRPLRPKKTPATGWIKPAAPGGAGAQPGHVPLRHIPLRGRSPG